MSIKWPIDQAIPQNEYEILLAEAECVKEFNTPLLFYLNIRKHVYFDRNFKEINVGNWIWVLPEQYKNFAKQASDEIIPNYIGEEVTTSIIDNFCIELSKRTIFLIRNAR